LQFYEGNTESVV